MGFGGAYVFWESGVRRSVLCWCVWQESGLSRLGVLTFNLLYKEGFLQNLFSDTRYQSGVAVVIGTAK